MSNAQNPSIGRIVHYVMPNNDVRPAIIVQVWPEGDNAVNLQVFTDGSNDNLYLRDDERASRGPGKSARCVVWRTSVPYNEENKPGTWHWPPRV